MPLYLPSYRQLSAKRATKRQRFWPGKKGERCQWACAGGVG